MRYLHRRHAGFDLRAIARACAWACLLGASGASSVSQAAVVTTGDVPGLYDNSYHVGLNGSGSATIDGGSVLRVPNITLGGQASGAGTLTVQGVGSWLDISGQLSDALNIGGGGQGTLQVFAGAKVSHVPDAACALCNVILGNAAGSKAQLTVGGTGSSFATTRDIYVGSTNVLSGTDANGNTWFWGTPGGSTRSELRVDTGGRVDSRMLVVGFDQPGRPAQTGNEVSTGHVIVDGSGSVLNLTRDARLGTTGDITLLTVGHSGNGSGTVELRNGGRITLDGSTAPLAFAGINIGGGSDASSTGVLTISGSGSQLSLQGGIGFINVGRLPNAHGTLEVTAGGLLDGSGVSGLPYLNVGRNGGSGAVLVSGADAAGHASTIRLAGMNPATGGGAFLQVGRTENGFAGQGSLRVLDGGQFVIDTSAYTLGVNNLQPGFHVGHGEGAVGTLELRGVNAVSGQASSLLVNGGDGVANWMAVGRDGASGQLTIADGAQLVATSQRVSTPNASGHLAGDEQTLNIGRRTDGGSTITTGVVTVTGSGSRLVLQGGADSAIRVGRGFNASGTLNIFNGGSASTTGSVAIAQGEGSTGLVSLDQGRLTVAGVQNGGALPGSGAAVSAGRGGGVGWIVLNNGSQLNISSSANNARLLLGGTTLAGAAGGYGSLHASDGSRVTISGPSAQALIGAVGSAPALGVGSVTLSRGSRFDVVGSGAALRIGDGADTHGTVSVDATSALSATALIGVAHNGTSDTGGSAVLIVNGVATAPQVVIGQWGLLGGSGLIVGNVVNQGVISPANSPGRLTIDGTLDTRSGRLVMEIEQQTDGSWLFDELVVTQWQHSLVAGAQISFEFLGNANPQQFLDAGLFKLDSFFKQGDGGALPSDLAQRFDSASFSAVSSAYQIDNFSFTAASGASFLVTAVPEPSTQLMMLSALLMGMGAAALRRRRGA